MYLTGEVLFDEVWNTLVEGMMVENIFVSSG